MGDAVWAHRSCDGLGRSGQSSGSHWAGQKTGDTSSLGRIKPNLKLCILACASARKGRTPRQGPQSRRP